MRNLLALVALPAVLLACTTPEPAVETVMADDLREGQRQACRSQVAAQIGQSAGDVRLSLSNISPTGTAIYNASSTAGTYRCEVDNAFRVVSLSPLDE